MDALVHLPPCGGAARVGDHKRGAVLRSRPGRHAGTSAFPPFHAAIPVRTGGLHRRDDLLRMGRLGQPAPGPHRQERLPSGTRFLPVARRLSRRRRTDIQHRFLDHPRSGGQTGRTGRRPHPASPVGSLGILSGLVLDLRLFRTPLRRLRPSADHVRLPAEPAMLALAGPVPAPLLRNRGTNHVQRQRVHPRHSFLHLACGRPNAAGWLLPLFSCMAFYSPLAAVGGLPR